MYLTMRGYVLSLAAAAGLGWGLTILPALERGADQRALPEGTKSLQAARAAIGGEARLREIRSLVLQGTITSGFNAVTGAASERQDAVEIRMRFPDYFLMVTDRWSSRRRSGFSGNTAIESVETRGTAWSSGDTNPAAVLRVERRRFAELALGLLAHIHTALPLRVESKPGTFRSLLVTGPDGFAATLDLDPATAMPASLRFWKMEVFPRAITAEEKRARFVPPLPPAEKVEVVVSFDDRRLVDGALLPFRIRRTARNVTLEDIRVRRFLVNPPAESVEGR